MRFGVNKIHQRWLPYALSRSHEMPVTTLSKEAHMNKEEMVRTLVAYSVKSALSEPKHYWLSDLFEKGFAGYRNLTRGQLVQELEMRGLEATNDCEMEELEDFDGLDVELGDYADARTWPGPCGSRSRMNRLNHRDHRAPCAATFLKRRVATSRNSNGIHLARSIHSSSRLHMTPSTMSTGVLVRASLDSIVAIGMLFGSAALWVPRSAAHLILALLCSP
jgi:hypothetical protein